MILEIDVDDSRLAEFLSLPDEVYRGDRDFCPTSSAAVRESLSRAVFRDRQRILVAEQDGRSVARLVARVSPTLTDEQGSPIGMIGFFESLDLPKITDRLFAAALDWLAANGAGLVVGPMDGDTWHRYRLNVGPYDRPPFLMEPYNRDYYPRLWESAGFVPHESYYSKHVADVRPVARKLERVLQRVTSSGYRLRRIDMDRYSEELNTLYRLSTAIFADNYLYEEISERDFHDLYEPARSIVDPNLVWFAEAPDGSDAGFLFATHDYHRAVAAMRGRRGTVARLKFLFNRRRADTVNIKSLGVLTEHRRSGLGAALICQGYLQSIALGYVKANLCLIRDGNPSGKLDGGQGIVSRRYVLYQAS